MPEEPEEGTIVTGEIVEKPGIDFFYLLVIKEDNNWCPGHEILYDKLQDLLNRIVYLKSKKTRISKILERHDWRIVKIPLPVKVKEK